MVPVLVPHINGIENPGLRSKFPQNTNPTNQTKKKSNPHGMCSNPPPPPPPPKEKMMISVLVLVLKIRPTSSLVLDNLDWNWRLISSFYFYEEILVKWFSPNYYNTPGQLPH